jgi:hypothetical protein
MRVSRTVLGGALGETPEVYSLHDTPHPVRLVNTSLTGYRPGRNPLIPVSQMRGATSHFIIKLQCCLM